MQVNVSGGPLRIKVKDKEVQTDTRQQGQAQKTVSARLAARESLHGGIDAISIPTRSLTNSYSQ
eukprot:9474233-Pyramimonas_sp.AAC.2